MNSRKGRTAIFVALVALPVWASATDHMDAELALTEAGSAVEAAERADAAQYATADFNTAHNMLTTAQAAFDHHHWIESAKDSEATKADANLAAARSRQHIAEAATAELDATVRSLRDQLNLAGDRP